MANEFIARKGLIALEDSQITGSLGVTQDVTASNAQLTTIAGPSDQLVELGNYPVGYDVISSFPITAGS